VAVFLDRYSIFLDRYSINSSARRHLNWCNTQATWAGRHSFEPAAIGMQSLVNSAAMSPSDVMPASWMALMLGARSAAYRRARSVRFLLLNARIGRVVMAAVPTLCLTRPKGNTRQSRLSVNEGTRTPIVGDPTPRAGSKGNPVPVTRHSGNGNSVKQL
jgi:hypothetical protein